MELTATQQNVINALAAGSTITAAAGAHNLNRVTIYRWMKSNQAFADTLRQARAEFVLARRDDLHTLSNRALDALAAIFDDPRASPSVILKAAIFVLTRPQLPKTGWSMPEPVPPPDSEKLIDSAIIEQDYASLPCLASIERDPEPEPAEAMECNEMQHDSEEFPAVTSAPPSEAKPPLPSCPIPQEVLRAREQRRAYAELDNELRELEKISQMTLKQKPPPAPGA